MVISEIDRITSRHVGRLLHRLKPLHIPKIAEDAIKGELWLMADDMKELAEKLEGEYGNNGTATTER